MSLIQYTATYVVRVAQEVGLEFVEEDYGFSPEGLTSEQVVQRIAQIDQKGPLVCLLDALDDYALEADVALTYTDVV